MIKWIANKLFSVPHYEALQIKGHLYCIVETKKVWGITFHEMLPCFYSDLVVHHRVKFLNSLYEKGPN